jgi:hypothetical protein
MVLSSEGSGVAARTALLGSLLFTIALIVPGSASASSALKSDPCLHASLAVHQRPAEPNIQMFRISIVVVNCGPRTSVENHLHVEGGCNIDQTWSSRMNLRPGQRGVHKMNFAFGEKCFGPVVAKLIVKAQGMRVDGARLKFGVPAR